MRQSSGFTIIELLIATAILVLATGLVLPGFNFWQKQSSLDSTAQEIISALRLAQNQTLASEGSSSFGVYFETDRFTVFKGTSFYSGSPDNNQHLLNPSLAFSEVSLGGNNFVVFDRLTGNTANYGSLKIAQINDTNKNKVIFVDPSGTISLASASPDDLDRKKDSRHVEFSYSQDAQNATTLSLYFPSSGITENIDWQDYLSTDKTQFSWEDSVLAGGSEQQIMIHTHSLSSASANFCVHRDQRYNSQALVISLDGQNLINYSSTGIATKGSSLWAGEPQSQ
jgi:Tfp pilus assembly protein FimT